MFHVTLAFVLMLYARLLLWAHAAQEAYNQCKKGDNRFICNNSNLSSVPRNISHKTLIVELSNNKITKIESGSFRSLHNLMTLKLSNNKITKIENGSFRDLPDLKFLHLENNEIADIEQGTFNNLHNLEFLTLSKNAITNISQGTFHHLYNLEVLDLSHNAISNLEDNTFKNLTSLKTLNLSKNAITNISQGTFHHLYNLEVLNLSHNKIQNIEDGAFLFLPKIKRIILRENNDLKYEYRLVAFVNYMKTKYNRTVEVLGLDNKQQDKEMPLNYSLFPKSLQCYTCSGIMCDDSQVTNCSGAEIVCQYKLSLNGVRLTVERSCITYSNCTEAMKQNSRLDNGSSYIACCGKNLCNKNDFMGWSSSFKFHMIYTIDPYLTSKFNENVSRALLQMEHDLLSNLPVDFKVEFCRLSKTAVIFTIYCTTLNTNDKNQVLGNITEILNTSKTLSNLGFQHRNMEFIDERYCNEGTSTNGGTFYWPMTKIGTNATIPCHANVATRQCSFRKEEHLELPTNQSVASRNCSPFTGVWLEPDMSQCNNTKWITQQLKNIASGDIDEETIELVSTMFLNISKKSVYFKSQDIESAVKVLEKMKPLLSNMLSIIRIINNIINVPETILIEAEKPYGSVSRMLDIIERIPEMFSLEGKQVTVLFSNLGIGAAKVEKDTFNGLVHAVSYETNETELKNEIYNESISHIEDDMNYISLPKSLFKHLKEDEQSKFSRVSIFCLQDDKLYRVIQKASNKTCTKIDGCIIAAKIPNVKITNLDEPVTISFRVTNQNATNPKCVYWDDSPGQNPHWSTNGCIISRYVPGNKVVCSCNHLTSFALLMDIQQNGGIKTNNQHLSVISNIGCGISFVCLVLTIIIHAYFKKLWNSMASKILVNLCGSLAATYLIFLVGFQSYSAKITAVCKAVAALLHYFLLTSFMWMTVEALHIYRGLFVFKTIRSSFLKRSSILVWGFPAIIVVVTLAINNTNNYIQIVQVCWLSKAAFYATFLAPVTTILLFNLIIFSLVMWHLNSMQNDRQVDHKTRQIRIFGIVGLCFLLGLPWLLAFFIFGEAAEVFQFFFAIFNTLQGLFIFLCYGIYKKDARDVVYPFLCKRKTRKPVQLPENIRKSMSGNEAEANL